MLRNRKKIILATLSILAIIASIIICIVVRIATEEERVYKKYEQIELGMTMDEVKKLLGKPEETLEKYFEEDDYISKAFALAEYGYVNAEFWYYRGREYDENVKADIDFDMDYEFQPYYQIRIAFNSGGEVIEAYFNSKSHYFSLLDDYGSGDDKIVKEIEYLDGAHVLGEQNEKVKISFEDGSAYLGEVEILTDEDGEYIDHRWSMFHINE